MKIEELRYSKGESYRSIPDDSSNFVKNNDGSVDIAGLGVEETDYTKGSPFLSCLEGQSERRTILDH